MYSVSTSLPVQCTSQSILYTKSTFLFFLSLSLLDYNYNMVVGSHNCKRRICNEFLEKKQKKKLIKQIEENSEQHLVTKCSNSNVCSSSFASAWLSTLPFLALVSLFYAFSFYTM